MDVRSFFNFQHPGRVLKVKKIKNPPPTHLSSTF